MTRSEFKPDAIQSFAHPTALPFFGPITGGHSIGVARRHAAVRESPGGTGPGHRSTLRRLPLLICSDRCIPYITSAASLTLPFGTRVVEVSDFVNSDICYRL